MLRLDNAQFQYDPYPIGRIHPILDENFYHELASSFPPAELFVYKASLGHKYSLSEVNNREKYEEYVNSIGAWRKFHRYLKSKDFIFAVIKALCEHSIDLGLPTAEPSIPVQLRSVISGIRRGRLALRTPRLSSRFEFSMLPSAGGCIKP